ncbi:ComEC/Rec2 family competence protein [Aquicoccus sp. G2-2]|uniref:ComEC/Rec2 family competence protein n=1 Tax=Aquicoccus sp. G2-2 TaxID=3092120 RepID=UPI002ADFF37D|nr:ComEC/Rec2 family competence protein [Aquicoccus sp. G2-2]MEA1113350.1 ComEC/Rec2 family competence protein [Aquicoccus sp. G2-2]
MGVLARAELALLGQRGHLFAWVPVCLGVGIGLYFGLRFEPQVTVLLYLGPVVLGLLLLAARWRAGWAALPWGAALVGMGFCLAFGRAHVLERPVLGWHYYGPVEGRVIGLDRSASGAPRVLLDRVVLARVGPQKTPDRVRISLHSTAGATPRAGARVMVTAHLSPPGGPVEPGGFDFQRHSWFQRLGAVGYARTPLLTLVPGSGTGLLDLRLGLSARVQAALPGEAGGFAAAIMTGDRSGMAQETLTALRVSNLAHLLAISGLHMGLLTGFVFAAVRLLLSLWPALALRVPVKKLAAVVALGTGAGYLALSGGNVATERAFVMAAVALVAVLADRRVISLRAVALAAVVVLVLWPEALLGPGFQMSFAATVALVAVFRWLRDREIGFGPVWLRPFVAAAISSAVAGLATAPVAAAHFNQISHYGLIANLLSVPLMGVLVMPAMLLAAVSMLFGLEAVPLHFAGVGLDWILGVAAWISGLEGARGTVISPDWRVLPLIGVGFILLVSWQGRFRMAGLVPVLAGLWFWVETERPDILIADNGGLVGVMGAEGRALSRAKGAGFISRNWLENDGDAASQPMAAARWAKTPAARPVRHLTRKADLAALSCEKGEVLVIRGKAAAGLPCLVYDTAKLRRSGATALYAIKGGYRSVTARSLTGERLWNQAQ